MEILTRILTAKATIEQRHGRKRIRINLPPNLAKAVQIAITAKGKGIPMQSNRVYFGLANGTKEETNPSHIDSSFAASLQGQECLRQRAQALDVLTDFGNIKVPEHPDGHSQSRKLFYAHPVRWGLAQFAINDQSGIREGGFLPPVLARVTDPETKAREAYFVYESINKGIKGTVNIAFSQPVDGYGLNRAALPPSTAQ